MKNTIFLMAMACLLASCAGKGPTTMKLKTEAEVTSKQGLPVKVMPYDDKPLPIKIVPDEIAIKALVASLIAACATVAAAIVAAITACFARKSAKAAAESAKATKLAAEGQLFVGLTREYVSDEIGKGIKELDDWWKKEGGAIRAVEEWQKKHIELTEDQLRKDASEILEGFGDKSQIISRVAIYFLTILQLYKSGYVSKEFAKSIYEITRITKDIEYFLELSIRANGGGNKKVEKFRNELEEIRHIEGA